LPLTAQTKKSAFYALSIKDAFAFIQKNGVDEKTSKTPLPLTK